MQSIGFSDTGPVERFWYPDDLQQVSAIPTGCAIGPFVFLSTQYPGSTGRPTLWDLPEDVGTVLRTNSEHRDGREGEVRAGTWLVYQQIERILESRGSSLGEIVRQRILVHDPADILPIEAVIAQVFADIDLPATVFNCVEFPGSDNRRGPAVEVVAFRSGKGEVLARVEDTRLGDLAAPYPVATRVGQLVFSSSVSVGAGVPGDLLGDDRFRLKSSGRAQTDQVHRDLRSQLLGAYAVLEAVMESQGANIGALLRQVFFTDTDRQSWGFTSLDRERLFPRPADFPTSSAFGVSRVGPDSRTRLVTDVIGLAAGAWAREAIVYEDVTMGHLPMCVAAGPYLFTTGYLAMDKVSHRPIGSFHQLSYPEARLGALLGHGDEELRAQAWHIYRQIVEILEDQGSSPRQVVQQTVYLTDPSKFAVVESVGRSVFGESLPATTVIGVDSMGPYPGLHLEIDVIAVR